LSTACDLKRFNNVSSFHWPTYLGSNTPPPSKLVHEGLRCFAVNADGKLEFFEFCDIIAKNRKSLDQEEVELNAAFRVFDKNGDGRVSKDELKKV
jgi:Ca2+-binding EF-hand superfamily protein